MKSYCLAFVIAFVTIPAFADSSDAQLVANCLGREIPMQYPRGLVWDGDFKYALTVSKKPDGTFIAKSTTREKTFSGRQIFYKRLGKKTAISILRALSSDHIISEDEVELVDYYKIGNGDDAEDGSSLGLYVVIGPKEKVLVKLVQDGWMLGRCLE